MQSACSHCHLLWELFKNESVTDGDFQSVFQSMMKYKVSDNNV